MNRGNERRIIYRHETDYVWFVETLAAAVKRCSVQVYGYCLMPNHFHLLLVPQEEHALSAFMQWLTGRYACDFRRVTDTVGHGHVFQRRFWSAPTRDPGDFLRSLRYIEGNPVRAGLVASADSWPWSSFADRVGSGRRILTTLPYELPEDWAALVNAVQPARVLNAIRRELVPRAGRPRKSPDGVGEQPPG